MEQPRFYNLLFWHHHCDLKTNGQKGPVFKKEPSVANFLFGLQKTGKVRLEEAKKVCNALGIGGTKLKP
jgi:hypothetical protein